MWRKVLHTWTLILFSILAQNYCVSKFSGELIKCCAIQFIVKNCTLLYRAIRMFINIFQFLFINILNKYNSIFIERRNQINIEILRFFWHHVRLQCLMILFFVIHVHTSTSYNIQKPYRGVKSWVTSSKSIAAERIFYLNSFCWEVV